MKSMYVVLVLVALVAGTAMGQAKPIGPLLICFDEDGRTYMENTGAEPFQFDGYSIASASGALDPVGWMTFVESTTADMTNFPPSLGQTIPQAFGWGELAATANLVSEAHLTAVATLAPGTVIDLGLLVTPAECGDLYFTYIDSATQGSWEGVCCPEPASLGLLGLGGLALLRRRR